MKKKENKRSYAKTSVKICKFCVIKTETKNQSFQSVYHASPTNKNKYY